MATTWVNYSEHTYGFTFLLVEDHDGNLPSQVVAVVEPTRVPVGPYHVVVWDPTDIGGNNIARPTDSPSEAKRIVEEWYDDRQSREGERQDEWKVA